MTTAASTSAYPRNWKRSVVVEAQPAAFLLKKNGCAMARSLPIQSGTDAEQKAWKRHFYPECETFERSETLMTAAFPELQVVTLSPLLPTALGSIHFLHFHWAVL